MKREDKFHHGNLHAALIAAGVEALESGGEVSLRDLARRVGVSPTAAYRHFADKSALMTAIAETGFADFAARMERAAGAGQPPQARIMDQAWTYMTFARERPAMFRLMFADDLPFAQGGTADMPAAQHAFQTLQETIHAANPAADAGQLRGGVVRFWAALHGYVVLYLAGRLDNEKDGTRAGMEAVIGPVIATL
ncbi:TetR/AcrR family transcriptional regulator [Tabrizicola sp.]|uniref:TetR/AcrR family transcriptional regulator n=1 Tax=Tabrizicola sp. TaxID=2005166 RepID=UPI003F300CD4